MATPVVMPQQGNTVESCLILDWKKKEGNSVSAGDVLCEIETDKATFDVEAPANGILLKIFFAEGEDVPVMTNIAVIGDEGESTEQFQPDANTADVSNRERPEPEIVTTVYKTVPDEETEFLSSENEQKFISPRAKHLAEKEGIPFQEIKGSGPDGRIIERDIRGALKNRQPLTVGAKTRVTSETQIPRTGTGLDGRITTTDLETGGKKIPVTGYKEIPVKGIRKLIADRMLHSMQTTAQLTLHTSSDASGLLNFRKKLKNSPDQYDLQKITINDLLLFAVSRVIVQHKNLNSLFVYGRIRQYEDVHLGFAVDTPRGLIVPVIKKAQALNLKQISAMAKKLGEACLNGSINPDNLQGATFTISNLGSLGIEQFTPILNPPQVGILGIGNIHPRPVQREDEVLFIPHISLSLTIDHQIIDGAVGAKFLQELSKAIAQIDLLLVM